MLKNRPLAFDPRLFSRSIGISLGLLALLGLGWLFVYILSWLDLSLSLCMFKRLTGIPCLTCGTTRSLMHLAHGRFLPAFSMNPMGTLGILLACGMIIFLVLKPGLNPIRARLEPFEQKISPQMRSFFWTALRWFVIVGMGLNWLYILIRRFYFEIPY